jgi:hypothetical protein
MLTCWSCEHWRRAGCAQGLQGWPAAKLSDCEGASYEPGADEIEHMAEAAAVRGMSVVQSLAAERDGKGVRRG